jgi:hypothetical protein
VIVSVCRSAMRVVYPAIESMHMTEIAIVVYKDSDGVICLQQEDRSICFKVETAPEIIKAIREVQKEKL